MRVRDYAALAALAAAAACGSSTTQPMNNNGAPCPGSAQKTVVSLAEGGVQAVTVPANLDCVSLQPRTAPRDLFWWSRRMPTRNPT